MNQAMTGLTKNGRIRGRAARVSVWAGLSGFVLFLAACAPPEVVEEDPVALRVGGQEVRLSELQAQVDFLNERGNLAASANRETFLERQVERLAALERARELGIDRDVELQRQWENLLIGRLRQVELDAELAAVRVSEEDIRDYYETHIERYSRPAQLHLALLFLGASSSDGGNARARLEEARALARELPTETRGFGALAMTYSEEATSRFKGGDVGWLRAGESQYRWPDSVVQAGFALSEKGEISSVIETEDGFYLLKKLDAREAHVRPLDEELSAALRTVVLNEKREEAAAGLRAGWRAGVATTLYDDVLARLEFSPDSEDRPAAETFSSLP